MPRYEMRTEEINKLEGQSEHWLLTRVFLHPAFRIGICVVPLLIFSYQMCMTWLVFPWDRFPKELIWARVFMTISAGIGTLFSCVVGIFGGKILLALEKNKRK